MRLSTVRVTVNDTSARYSQERFYEEKKGRREEPYDKKGERSGDKAEEWGIRGNKWRELDRRWSRERREGEEKKQRKEVWTTVRRMRAVEEEKRKIESS